MHGQIQKERGKRAGNHGAGGRDHKRRATEGMLMRGVRSEE